MHVLLLILKILGIIVLILFVLLLAILYAVLFVGVSWRIDLKKEDTFRISGSAGWLFRIVTVRYQLNVAEGWKQDLQIRLFGFPILKPFEEKKPKKEKRKGPKKEKKQQEKNRKKKPEKAQIQQPVRESQTGPKEPVQKDITDDSRRETFIPPDSAKKRSRKKREGRFRAFFRKLDFAIRSFCDKIKHIWQSVLGVGDTIRNLTKRKDDLLEFWNLEEHRNARGAIWKEVLYLWKKSRPKKIQGEITFGFDDPSLTGRCLGLASMLYAWYPKKLWIIPDFDQKIFRGDILIRGKIRCYVFACILWRVYFNRDARHMYEHWKQL